MQYYLIYKNYKDLIPHEKIIILFFPFNDFNENDYKYWHKTNKKFFGGNLLRHRPYFNSEEKNFDFFIPKEAVKRENWYGDKIKNKSIRLRLELFIINNFWSGNIYKSIKLIINSNPIKAFTNPYSGYFDPSIMQQEKSLFYIEKILKLSKNQQVILLSIPRPIDLKKIKNKSYNLKGMLWYQKFTEFEKNKNYNFKFVDLSKFQNIEDKEIFHKCDGHWSKKGHNLAFSILKNYISF